MKSLKVTVGSVLIRKPQGASQDPSAFRRSLGAGLVRTLTDGAGSDLRDASVLRARVPAPPGNSNMGTAIAGAIGIALKKGR